MALKMSTHRYALLRIGHVCESPTNAILLARLWFTMSNEVRIHASNSAFKGRVNVQATLQRLQDSDTMEVTLARP